MSESSRQQTLRDVREWDVMMTTGSLFPKIEPKTIQKINVPTLLLSGWQWYPFLGLITGELAHLLPDSQSIVFSDGAPDVCVFAREILFQYLLEER